MERRNFLRETALIAPVLLSGSRSLASGHSVSKAINSPFHLDYAIHEGMFANHAGKDFVDQIKFAYDRGFRSIEDNGMMARSPQEQERIGNTLRSLGMKMGVFVITTDSWHWRTTLTTGKQEWKDRFVRDCRTAIDVARRCGATHVTVVPGNVDRSLAPERQTAHVIDALRRAAEVLEPARLVMVLEPLSDNPDLFLRYSEQTFMICKAVASPSCKLLYDIYHMQRNEGDLLRKIDQCWEEIGYIQIGDNPGRKEPTTGEIHYRNVFRHIHGKGYTGILGMEHGVAGKGKEGELALIRAYREVDDFL